MTPLKFVTRERILQAQATDPRTSRSLMEIALEVGTRVRAILPQVFRRTVGVTPTKFRNAL